MFLTFTLVLLFVAVGILASVYSVFFPFMQNLWTINQYHMAYYGALSSIERAELGLRYRAPWFQWSGWFLWDTYFGPISDYTPSMLSGINQWFWWNIDSRTTSIPSTGMGNTDPMLSYPAGDSKDYNQLWYVNLETFLFSYDTTSASGFYSTTPSHLHFFTGDGNNITGMFRLPPKVFDDFVSLSTASKALLCDSDQGDCDADGDTVFDDIALSWSLEWYYNGNGFKIFPTIATVDAHINEPRDNTIRESVINDSHTITFANNFTPIAGAFSHGSSITQHNVVSVDAAAIETTSFSDIFTLPNFSGLRLSFGATNLFRTFTNALYPYVEYQFSFPQEIADRFYMIEGHGRVGEYDVQIVLKKPTVQWTVGGDFTVIF